MSLHVARWILVTPETRKAVTVLLNSVISTLGCTLSTLGASASRQIEKSDDLVTVVEDPRGKGAFQVGRTHDIRR